MLRSHITVNLEPAGISHSFQLFLLFQSLCMYLYPSSFFVVCELSLQHSEIICLTLHFSVYIVPSSVGRNSPLIFLQNQLLQSTTLSRDHKLNSVATISDCINTRIFPLTLDNTNMQEHPWSRPTLPSAYEYEQLEALSQAPPPSPPAAHILEPPAPPQTPLPAYVRFEQLPPTYARQAPHQYHERAWFCCQCKFTTGNVLLESTNGFVGVARCETCRHNACPRCLWDKILQSTSLSTMRAITSLTESCAPISTFCEHCGKHHGAEIGETDARRPLLKRAKTATKVIGTALVNWATTKSLELPMEGLPTPRTKPMACFQCGHSFTSNWATFHRLDGEFDPGGTAMRVIRLREELAEVVQLR
ncbi:hypothetical protein BU16DRAFT_603523 [Lophium mytilinum]|uniref:Probable double zinc ribbon domain-containing protein n=1 Tax=Lophium mytilinum TaxID=390894 RepID=A0A6A6R537_9PEZI|nr:hypothetical protein BU16DRAFT_603523 [Lophium mytilinum]